MKTREREIYKVTLIGTCVNAVLIILKFVAGIVGHSSAMLADAVHSFSDFVTDVIVLVFVKIAGKPKDSGHDYGHGKYETFATLIIGIILAVAGIALLANGAILVYHSLMGDELPQPAMPALIIALVSVLSKEWLYRYTVSKGKKLSSGAVMANAWHHRSDAFSSVGTLFGIAGAIFLGGDWRILDPLAAIVVSFFIIKSGYKVIKPCVGELLEASLPESQEQEIMDLVCAVPGIHYVHNLRSRRIGNGIAVDLHAKMDGGMTLTEAHAKATAAEQAIRARFGENSHVNIHMEPSSHA